MMTTSRALAAAALACALGCAQQAEHQSHHPNGQLKQRGMLRDGLRHGRWTTWYEGGERRSERAL